MRDRGVVNARTVAVEREHKGWMHDRAGDALYIFYNNIYTMTIPIK